MYIKPFIWVHRLAIIKGNKIVYNEEFHPGLNIIRGENSSGKSTIMNFLFYGLGGDLTLWSDAARQCDIVYVEVIVNNMTVTLRREISSAAKRPMDLYGGPFEEALNAPSLKWNRYPYTQAGGKESFSQAIFRLLGIPEVSNEFSGKITIHQLLRLIYCDQLSPVENLFRFEQFDSPNLREAVGRLLCGAYDNDVYQNEERLKAADKELSAIKDKLAILFSLLKGMPHSLTLEWLNTERNNLSRRIKEIQSDIIEQQQKLFVSSSNNVLTLESQVQAQSELIKVQFELSAVIARREKLQVSLLETQSFVDGLESRIQALQDSSLVRQAINDFRFVYCPSCFAELKEIDENNCHLCGSDNTKDQVQERIVMLINDLVLQLRKSTAILKKKGGRTCGIESDLPNAFINVARCCCAI